MINSRHRHPLLQTWPPEFVARYRAAGYWRGETMASFLKAQAQRRADHTALVGYPAAGGTSQPLARWSYAQFWQKVETAAAGFLASGLQPGDRVVVQMSNVPEFYSVVFGLFRAGLIPVYALPAHRTREIAHFIDKAEASAYVALQQYENFDYRTLARELRQQAFSHDLFEQVFIVGGDAAEFTAFDAFQSDAARLPDLASADADPQTVAFLQISGGSTGLSKLIPRTHDDYIYSFRASNEICGITQDSVYMVALPAAHNFPMSSPGAFGAFYAGATVVLSPSPSPEAAFPLIASERVTAVGLVPPLALLWAQAASGTGGAGQAHDLSSLRTLQVGGAKLTPEAARRVSASLSCQLQQVFGMAEGLVNYTRLDDDEATVIETQGRPISADDEVLVVDDLGQPVPEGQPGYLLTRGPYTIRRYHNDDAANARSFTDDGYYPHRRHGAAQRARLPDGAGPRHRPHQPRGREGLGRGDRRPSAGPPAGVRCRCGVYPRRISGRAQLRLHHRPPGRKTARHRDQAVVQGPPDCCLQNPRPDRVRGQLRDHRRGQDQPQGVARPAARAIAGARGARALSASGGGFINALG